MKRTRWRRAERHAFLASRINVDHTWCEQRQTFCHTRSVISVLFRALKSSLHTPPDSTPARFTQMNNVTLRLEQNEELTAAQRLPWLLIRAEEDNAKDSERERAHAKEQGRTLSCFIKSPKWDETHKSCWKGVRVNLHKEKHQARGSVCMHKPAEETKVPPFLAEGEMALHRNDINGIIMRVGCTHAL